MAEKKQPAKKAPAKKASPAKKAAPAKKTAPTKKAAAPKKKAAIKTVTDEIAPSKEEVAEVKEVLQDAAEEVVAELKKTSFVKRILALFKKKS